jgi:hypothetical protein
MMGLGANAGADGETTWLVFELRDFDQPHRLGHRLTLRYQHLDVPKLRDNFFRLLVSFGAFLHPPTGAKTDHGGLLPSGQTRAALRKTLRRGRSAGVLVVKEPLQPGTVRFGVAAANSTSQP